MTTEEILTELQDTLMGNPQAATLFGYAPGTPYLSHFSPIGAMSVILYVVAYVIALKERLLDDWIEQVRAVADTTRYGTEAWWKAAAKAWRQDEQTTVSDGAVGYASPATAQTVMPVAYAAVRASGRQLTLLVAADSQGTPIPLSASQLSAFAGYVQDIKPLGIAVQCVSGPANPIGINATITYNPEYTGDAVQQAVTNAINTHCAEIDFGGTLYAGRLAAAVMQLPAVIDCAIHEITIRNAADPSSASPEPVTISVRPNNGYCQLDTAASNITYTPYTTQ